MTNRATAILGLVAVGLLPRAARAQGAAPPGGTVSILIQEIRLLRHTLEKQGSTTARAQLLIGRLTLQDQRTARARQAVERLESEVANAERERDQMQVAARDTAEALGRAADEERREQVEKQARMLRARIADFHTEISRGQSRLLEARQTLDSETARYEELEALLRDLDRQLESGN